MSGSRTLVSVLLYTAREADGHGHSHDLSHDQDQSPGVDKTDDWRDMLHHAHTHPPGDAARRFAADAPGGEGGWGASGPGTVILDIGGCIGALVVVVSPQLAGREIEVEEARATSVADTHRIHTAVRERTMGAGSQFAAVFAAIPAGRWLLSVRGDSARETVDIAAGSVTERDWR